MLVSRQVPVFQRVKALKEAGYFVTFTADLNLNNIVENVLAYVEFRLENNNPKSRKKFEDAIEQIPEFMDCLCLLYTSPSPRDGLLSRMPSSA